MERCSPESMSRRICFSRMLWTMTRLSDATPKDTDSRESNSVVRIRMDPAILRWRRISGLRDGNETVACAVHGTEMHRIRRIALELLPQLQNLIINGPRRRIR